MAAPLFSVIIPTYNRSKYLLQAIESILKQTVKDWEVIVVDDASTDNTEAVVKSIQDSRIIYLRNEKNNERGYSRNRGIDNAKGKFIAFLDSDDAFEPDHLEVFQKELAKTPNFSGMLFTNSKLLNQSTGEITLKEVLPFTSAANRFAYLLQYTPNPARVCITADVFRECRFDASVPGLEDLDLWLHIANKYAVKHILAYTSVYREHIESYTTGDPKRYEKELRNFTLIFNKPELKNVLPVNSTNRLLSMCYYHLSASYETQEEFWKMYKAIFKSFILYPKGYNGRTNKVLLVRAFYNMPVLGFIAKQAWRFLARK